MPLSLNLGGDAARNRASAPTLSVYVGAARFLFLKKEGVRHENETGK
jgi:hypothetical protein